MKIYQVPVVRNIEVSGLKAKTQVGSQQFTLSNVGDLGDDDACSLGSEQNFNGWRIGTIQAGASIQVTVIPDDTLPPGGGSEGTDLVLSILDANNNPISGCVDANPQGSSEAANFIAPNTGIYEIHVFNNDVGNCNTCDPTYTLTVSGNQAEPTTFVLDAGVECDTDLCQHAPID